MTKGLIPMVASTLKTSTTVNEREISGGERSPPSQSSLSAYNRHRPFFKNTIILFFVPLKFCISIVSNLSWGNCKSQEKLKTMLMQNFGGTKKSIMEFLKKAYKLNKKPLQTLKFLFIFSQTDWCLQLWRVTLRALYQPNTEPWRKTATNRTDVEQKSERVSGTVRGWRSRHSLVNDRRHCCVRTNDNVKHACTPFSFATFAFCAC